ncbi:hypothetical protein D9613_005054 [Agrocybe pediades]|uniref:Uncharacterized protein n=1 Tax=Agrocybe pediades TaxID=84607 RepID=A0A8H4QYL3_9AGAR|nr:hypothetical protein D9613_005054 [Agrocybe pediades]
MEPDYSPPPPAYSEEDFDRKVGQATELSLLTPPATANGDGWQHYHSPAFTNQSSTSKSNAPLSNRATNRPLPNVVPLRIEKKTYPYNIPDGSHPADSRPRPSGYDVGEAYPSNPASPSSGHFGSQLELGTSQVEAGHHVGNLSVGLISTRGGGSHDDFDPYRNYPNTAHSQNQSNTHRPHQPHIQQSFQPSRSSVASAPRIDFNPAIAYGKETTAGRHAPRRLPIPYNGSDSFSDTPPDPSAFYHSAVSAQLKPVKTHRLGQNSQSYRQSQQPLQNNGEQYMASRYPYRPTPDYASSISSISRSDSDRMSVYSTDSSATRETAYSSHSGHWY